MLEHRVAGEADLAGDLDAFVARRHGGKGDAGVHDVALDAVEAPQEIEMPPGAAEFAVGDGLQAGRFLLLDDVLDLAVLDRLQRGGVDLAFGAALARLFQRGRPQQAADMIGAERRLGSLHCPTSLSPDFVGDFDDHAQLRPLLVLGQRVALLGRGEAALRRQAELVEIDELRRLRRCGA